MRLFEPVVEEARQHPNFKSILKMANGFVFDVLDDWARGFTDRDGKFVIEFQTTFNSSFWELYIFAILKHLQLSVDFTEPSPDFYVPGLSLNIEATIASNAQGSEPEWAHRKLEKIPTDLNEFNRSTIIRLSNGLVEKHRKYVGSYSKLDHVRCRPYVVAISNFDQPWSFMAAQRPIEAVLHGYYVDEERYLAQGPEKGKLEGEDLLRVFKDNGSPVELGMFTTPAYKDISAVIFSSCANMGKVRALSSDPVSTIIFSALRLNPNSTVPHVIREPKRRYEESLLDGLRVYHNPFAEHPLDPAVFRNRSVFQSYYENGAPIVEQHEGQLLMRNVWTPGTK
jgi:hypothetical protein